MIPPDALDIPDSDRNWKAPEEIQEVLLARDIAFAPDVPFRNVDGNFDVLKSSDRIITDLDIARSIGSVGEKVNDSLDKLLKGLRLQLHDPRRATTPKQLETVQSLRQGKPTFVEVDTSEVNESFIQAAEAFPGTRPGLILIPEGAKSINQISAIKQQDGKHARLMAGESRSDLADFMKRVNFLTPHMEGRQLDQKTVAYAMEFLEHGERPKTISQTEMEDWLARAQESALIFGFDVARDDPSLDNFVRHGGKLYWIDGNIRKATPAKTPDELGAFIEQQRATLEAFVSKEATS